MPYEKEEDEVNSEQVQDDKVGLKRKVILNNARARDWTRITLLLHISHEAYQILRLICFVWKMCWLMIGLFVYNFEDFTVGFVDNVRFYRG